MPIKFNDEILIREPKSTDAKALMDYINPMTQEPGISISMDKPVTLKEEKEYLKGVLKLIKEGIIFVRDLDH